jgi:hypothetical protein
MLNFGHFPTGQYQVVMVSSDSAFDPPNRTAFIE